MTQQTVFRRFPLAVALTAALAASPLVTAEELSRATYKQLNEARELMQAKAFDKAVLQLDKLLEKTEPRYDRAIVLQTQGYALLESGEQAGAIRAFEQSMALKALPAEAEQQVQYALGQLYAANGDYAKSAAVLEAWFDKNRGGAKASDYVLLANVYAQTGAHTKGIAAISRAIRMSSEPNRTHYDLLLALAFEGERYAQAADALEDMIQIWPKEKNYWTQLANVYINDNKTIKAHSVLKLAYQKGLLTSEKDLMNLVQLGLSAEIPDHAARVLQDGIKQGIITRDEKHLNTLAVAWARAKETQKAVETYELAADVSGSGEYHLRQAELYSQEDRWKESLSAAGRALAKGNLKSPGRAHLLRGMAYTQLREYPQGMNAFSEARRYDDTSQVAARWLQYIRERQEVGS